MFKNKKRVQTFYLEVLYRRNRRYLIHVTSFFFSLFILSFPLLDTSKRVKSKSDRGLFGLNFGQWAEIFDQCHRHIYPEHTEKHTHTQRIRDYCEIN